MFSLIFTFLAVFVPFWLAGKVMVWVSKKGLAWCEEQRERLDLPAEPPPKRRRRPSHLRLVP